MKKLRSSKTFWVNMIGLLAMIVQMQTGFVIDASMQASILVVVNIILRMITNEAIDGI